MTSDLANRLEAFLFAEGGSLSRKKLLQLLECKPEELDAAVEELSASLSGRGISLIKTETEVSLAVSSSTQGALEKAFEKELGREIGEAGLEVLAIVLYRGPSTRAQIDYVRGVNSSTSVRTLLARGLLERAGNPDDSREYLPLQADHGTPGIPRRHGRAGNSRICYNPRRIGVVRTNPKSDRAVRQRWIRNSFSKLVRTNLLRAVGVALGLLSLGAIAFFGSYALAGVIYPSQDPGANGLRRRTGRAGSVRIGFADREERVRA